MTLDSVGSPLEAASRIAVGDVLRLKKNHPCGASDWLVREATDEIHLECTGCGRRIELPRRSLIRRVRYFVRARTDVA